MSHGRRVRGLVLVALLCATWACGRARYQGGADAGMDAAEGDAPAGDDASEDATGPDAVSSDDTSVPDDAPALDDALVSSDAPGPDVVELPDVAMPDAFVERDAPAGPDAATDPVCAAVLADPTAASDADVFDCAVRVQLGRCSINAAFGCGGGCACNYYMINPGWDCTAACPTDVIRTGCFEFTGGGLALPPAPIDCGASTTAEQLGACIVRHEILAGHCGACVCP